MKKIITLFLAYYLLTQKLFASTGSRSDSNLIFLISILLMLLILLGYWIKQKYAEYKNSKKSDTELQKEDNKE
jgi:ABC-type Fe3+ transport system permease subunit